MEYVRAVDVVTVVKGTFRTRPAIKCAPANGS